MMRRRLCQATFTWKLSCTGPLLIADGRYDKPKTEPSNRGKLPHKIFVSRAASKEVEHAVAHRPGEPPKLPFYVPGTSLRGPLRAQAERIVRSLRGAADRPPATACDPFAAESAELASCSARLTSGPAEPSAYAAACPACKLFGCTATASRLQLADADLAPGYRSVFRDMIGIDRFTGGVARSQDEEGEAKGGANMRFHALEGTTFTTRVTVTNFELWQLGLLAYVFKDFEEGMVAIGFGKSKGFGQVSGTVTEATLSYPPGQGGSALHHLGSLASEAEHALYGLHDWSAPALAVPLARRPDGGLALYETYHAPDLEVLWRAAAEAFDCFVRQDRGAQAPGGAAA